MNNSWRIVLHALAVAGTLVALGGAASAKEPNDLKQTLDDVDVGEHWHYNDWETAKAAAQESNKPIMALFR